MNKHDLKKKAYELAKKTLSLKANIYSSKEYNELAEKYYKELLLKDKRTHKDLEKEIE